MSSKNKLLCFPFSNAVMVAIPLSQKWMQVLLKLCNKLPSSYLTPSKTLIHFFNRPSSLHHRRKSRKPKLKWSVSFLFDCKVLV